ncbi:MAG: GatB/YqeY domain-containing protein [Calditrichaeota bacterium]|nr:MAG: GatB/YqeY domain-containing protein [Calditrichota bacterium]
MSLEQQLMEDMKAALKAGDRIRLETIRGLRAQLKNAQIEKGESLTEDDVIRVLMNAAKKRKEAIEQYRSLGKEDRAAEEEQELRIIQSYLPEQMSEEELARLIEDVVREVGATSIKDMGKVMGVIMPRVKGKADGKVVQQMVRTKLTSL